MTHRKRPPDRRPSITRRLSWRTEFSEHHFHVTIGVDAATGQPVEVFYADGQRIGSQLQHAIQDACVLISLLLQYGVAPCEIAKTLSSTPVHGEPQPATVIGVIAEAIKEGVVRT
jgi:hypothetical protein